MQDAAPRRKAGRSEQISELFRILKFMASDKDVPETYFRIAFRIAQYANWDTGWAIVSDRTLTDVLPRTDEKKLRKFRRFMERDIEGKKWLRTVEGERGKPTSYLFIPDRIPEIEKRLAAAAEKRESEFAMRKTQERTALHVSALGGQITPDNLDGEIGLPGQISPPSMGGDPAPFTGSDLPPLLPQTPTSEVGYRKENLTQDARASVLAGAPARARADPPRCRCGELAISELRLKAGGEFHPHCFDCGEDAIPVEVRPLLASGDPVADYRTARDPG